MNESKSKKSEPPAEYKACSAVVVDDSQLIQIGSRPENLTGVVLELSMRPNIDINVIERMFELSRKEEERASELSFNRAMAAAALEMPGVVKDSKNNLTMSKYASLGAITKAIRPVYTKHGFAMIGGVSDCPKDGHIRVTMDIIHADGHSRRSYYDAPIDDRGLKGMQNKTPTHAMGSTLTYAQRYLKCLIWDVQIEEDNDGQAVGPKEPVRMADEKQIGQIIDLQNAIGVSNKDHEAYLEKRHGVKDNKDLTYVQARDLINALNAKLVYMRRPHGNT